MTGRHYKIDGERYPSVTTILGMLEKSGLAKWRGNVGNAEADRISKEATDHGTAIHALVEQVNLGRRSQLGPLERAIIAPYVQWFDENVSEVLGAEKLIVSRRHKYAGTADGVVILKGDTDATVIDFKTSKTDLAQREWQLQLAAYALGLEEENIDATRRIILRIPKNEAGALYPLELPADRLAIDQRAFLYVLKIWRWHTEQGPVRRAPGPRIGFAARTTTAAAPRPPAARGEDTWR